MGHEITHGFDTQGANFDGNGNAIDWWDETTRERFQAKAQCMEEQYSNYCFPTIGICINGKLTIGENIADNGGLRESYRAYRQYIERLGQEEPRLPGLEQLTPDQLFFIAYANVNC
jgi:membrane metallo-endopeptidase-like protein 1